MYALELLYPLALGAANVAAGWLLYTLLASGVGAVGLLFGVLLGALVVVAMLSEAVSRAVTDGSDPSTLGQ